MKINLKQYQEKAVNSLREKIYSFLLKNDTEKRIITFQAPTGSGKTVMMGSVIESLIVKNEEDKNLDFTFIWLSIGKGNLHNQSKKALENLFGEYPIVQSIDEIFGTNQSELYKDRLIVVNWEKIRAKDGKSQKWKSVAMKDGENINFREILDNTQNLSRKIVLIIDESQSSTDAKRGREIIDLMKPNVVVEVSATPDLKVSGEDVIEERGWMEKINPQDVITEQMIKDQILVNHDFVLHIRDDSDQTVLRSAIMKRDDLAEMYRQEGIDVNPLLLIQLPNSEKGESVKKMVLNHLREYRGVGEDDRRLAIWLNETDSKNRNIEGISSNNAPQEFLLFKQAIDTGWDCPRAQVLLKFRESNSEIFNIQILGRILRMPEQKHYGTDALNKAYVYVNSQNNTFKIEDYSPKILGDQPAGRIKGYKPLRLKSFFKERADYQDIRSDFKNVLIKQFTSELDLAANAYEVNIKKLEKNGWNLKAGKLTEKVLAEVTVSIEELSGGMPTGGVIKDLGSSERKIEFDSKDLFKSMMAPFTNVARSVPMMNTAWLVTCLVLFGESVVKVDYVSSQVILLLNRDKIGPIFHRAVKKYSEVRQKKAREDTEHGLVFEIPERDYFNGDIDEEVNYPKHVLQPCWLSKNRSKPEREFEKFLDGSGQVVWWYKNGEMRKDYFGIRYEYDNQDGKDTVHTFYPDYIVQFNDGKIGIFETKDESDRDTHTFTKAKSEALHDYLKKGKNMLGGIVVFKDREWQINDSKTWKRLEL